MTTRYAQEMQTVRANHMCICGQPLIVPCDCNFFQEDDIGINVDVVAPTTQISIKHGLPRIEICCRTPSELLHIDQMSSSRTSFFLRLYLHLGLLSS
jgi:hypothetical protein